MADHPCLRARSHLSDYLDGEPLSLGARLLVRFHLTVCPPCKRFHASLVATQDCLHALRDADVAPEALTDVDDDVGKPE